jgi:hypothetical protein
MTPEERLKKAVELLESQPEFAGVQVQIHDRTRLIASKVSSGAKKLATPARLRYIVDLFDAHAEAYQRLIHDVETQKAAMLFLDEIARRSWEQFTGHPSLPIPHDNIPGNRQLQRLQTRIRFWREEGWKRLDSLRPPAQPANNRPERRGYRDHIRAWMKRTGIDTIPQAAKRLGVSESTLKSVMSTKIDVRYGADTLAEILKKTGYQEP